MVAKKIARNLGGLVGKHRLARQIAAAVALGAFLPVGTALAAAEENKEASTNYLDLVDYLVTAERIPTSKWDTPADVTIITAKDIEDNHFQNLSEILSHLPGVFTPAQGGRYINGDNRVLLLVDGVKGLAVPTLKNVERIEVVRGGGSALYGSEAVGGVINVITKKGEKNETTIDLNTGSWHQHKYEITNQGNDGKLGWYITAGIDRARPFNYSGSRESWSPQETSSDRHAEDVVIRLDHRFDERNSLTLVGQHYTNHYNGYAPDYGLKSYKARSSLNENNVMLSYNFKEGTATPGFLRYFNEYTSIDEFDEDGHARGQGVDYQNGWNFGQHKVVVGAEWHQENLSWWGWNYDGKKVTNQAAYIQDTITMGDKWTLVPGVRFDNHSSFGHQWSPKIAANYRADDKTKFFASWGRVYQAPSILALNSSYHRNAFDDDGWIFYREYMFGNSNLRPESGHTETIGLEHDFSDKASIALSLFNSRISDGITTNNVDYDMDYIAWYEGASWYGYPTTASFYVNDHNKEKRRGISIAYKQKIDEDWSYDLGYSHNHIERLEGSSNAFGEYSEPKHSYRLGVHYQHGPWKANLYGIMGNGFTDKFASSKYAVIDLNASYAINDQVTFYVRSNNLTNQNYSYVDYRFRSPGRSVLFGVNCKF